MTEPTTVKQYLDRINSDSAAALAIINEPPAPPDAVIVKAGEDLQAALDQGGTIGLEAGATFEGCYHLHVPGTRLFGRQAALVGPSHGPAVRVPPGSRDVVLDGGTATTAWDDSVIQIGEGDGTQAQLEDVPRQIVVKGVRVPTHRGKRAFAINGAEVLIDQCTALDVYDPAGRDSQGLFIWNTPGPVHVRGGVYQAGSECLLVGGDTTAIQGVVPTHLLFEDLELSRPLSWMTDGVKRKVKNLYELKAGIDVVLRRARLSGCWVDGQVGFAVMITPRDGKEIRDVLLEDIHARDIGSFASILGYDDGAYSPQARDLVFRRIDTTAHATPGATKEYDDIAAAHRDRKPRGGRTAPAWGSGRFIQWQASPANVRVEDARADVDGTAIYVNPGLIWTDQDSQVESDTTEGVVIERNHMTLRPYGIMLNGYSRAERWQEAWPAGVISGNTFTEAGADVDAYRANLPLDNTVEE